ncbi:phage integrase SAM-like domain-containing protein [Anaerosporobacter faecicola]|uniref:phage integrase SAM-like domain-containing protein n=1 Tax=Anaerosporobacter faecicola TaxID=2718714 RepID=UPI001EE574B5|nr:phage integrase N-terminal SAM-like domain-containing protein [Anaerosporobacter faecicola]
MLLEDVLKEFIFDCKLRKLSDRTIKSYQNNNRAVIRFIKNEYDIVEIEEVNQAVIKSYIKYLMINN